MKKKTLVICPKSGWQAIDFRELKEYGDLFYFMVWRDIKVRYAQSVLGIGWAIIQPVFSMIVFTVIFGNLAKVPSDGVNYAVFSFTALVPWTYFSNSLMDSSSSLINSKHMLDKIYFPRLILPFSSIIGKLVDFCISFLLLIGLLFWFQTKPSAGIFMIPLLVVLMMMTSMGMGSWLAGLSIQYRDIKYGMNFAIQLLMYAAPVVYPASLIPEKYRLFYALNPMVGVIEGFRSALLSTNPMPYDLILVGWVSALVLFLSGIFYFKKTEKYFADVA